MFTCLLVVAEAGGGPAHRVEGGGFLQRVVEGTADRQGVGGVAEGTAVVPTLARRPGERVVGVDLFGTILDMFGKGECAVQVVRRFVVAPHLSVCDAEMPLAVNSSDGIVEAIGGDEGSLPGCKVVAKVSSSLMESVQGPRQLPHGLVPAMCGGDVV